MSTINVKHSNFDGIHVIALAGGNMFDKGQAYGENLKGTLEFTRNHLVSSFGQHNVTHAEMAAAAQPFYDRYSYKFKLFLDGVAKGSGLSADDVNILNGMETIHHLLSLKDPSYQNTLALTGNTDLVHCAFISIPPEKTSDGHSIIGRNYDYPPEIYGEIAKSLTVTIINDEDTVSTALIGMPGEIYCPSCVNENGLFMELNNGMPSGGYTLDQDRESLLIRMAEVMQNSPDLEAMHSQMMGVRSDYSLIVNTANDSYAQSYEYSTNVSLGMKPYSPEAGETLVYTNFYLNQTWGNEIPVPTDPTTWEGVTRRDNLLNLASKSDDFDLDTMKSLMDIEIQNGGAYWDLTIYQLIFQPHENELSIKRTFSGNQTWVDIDLDDFYSLQPKEESPEVIVPWYTWAAGAFVGAVFTGIGVFMYFRCSSCQQSAPDGLTGEGGAAYHPINTGDDLT